MDNNFKPRGGGVANYNNSKVKKISGVSRINQYSIGLPTGCETVSAVMLMKFYKLGISAKQFVNKYLIRKKYSNGKGPDPNSAFVGSPYSTSNSFGIYAPAMTKSMNKYLKSTQYRAVNISGLSLNSIIKTYTKKGVPVMIWGTIGMKKTKKGVSWRINYTDSNSKYRKGSMFTWVSPEHCLVLIGYDDNYYYFNDPATGQEEKYSKYSVEESYNSLGKQAIVLK